MELTRDILDKHLSAGKLAKVLDDFFNDDWLEKQAKASKFIFRSSSRLTGRMFLLLNVLELGADPTHSLQDQCDWLLERFGVKLTKQSLDEGYNTFSVEFLKSCFQRMFNQWLYEHSSQVQGHYFPRILLRDSTSWQLAGNLSVFYPSKESSKTGASIKIDYCLDYVSGKVSAFTIVAGRLSDSHINTHYPCELQAGDLLIRDLGYWNIGQLEDYHRDGIYFLSRLRSDAYLSQQNTDGSWQAVKLAQYLPGLQGRQAYHLGLGKNHLPVWVYIEKVPEAVRVERLEKLQKQAKSLAWNLSEERKELCAFNLYVTNAAPEKIPPVFVREVYGLRWQIESDRRRGHL